jgi:FKBP-type peptidyl-prolyl cis-trans isomerase
VTLPTGPSTLETQDLVVGTGATAVNGDTVSVFYTGSLLNGQVFDTNVGGTALTFPLGQGRLIAGFEQGILGMRVGGKRRMTIPASLAYGSQGRPPQIPPNAALQFDVDLVAIAGK